MKRILLLMVLTIFIFSCSVSKIEETYPSDTGQVEPELKEDKETTSEQPPEIPYDPGETENTDEGLSPDDSLEVEELDEDFGLLEDDDIDMDLSSIEEW